MNITLDTLTLKNFKGLRKFIHNFHGQNTSVYGDNATGKTTLYDAFLWLLFDKDSLNRSSFGIKTLGQNGEVINGLDHEVEAVLDVDDKQITLKKVFFEKWSKTRGGSEKVFSGHTTDHFVNDVPKSQKEYKDKIAELGNENIFRLLTDPRFFNEQLHWQDRRKMLLEVCGDISDQDVIASNKKLDKLSSFLDSRSIDDHKKVIAAKRKKINEQLEKIPVRIDEVQNGLPDIKGLDFELVQAQVDELRSLQDTHRKTISRIESGGEIAQKEKEIAQIDTELLRMRSEHENKKRNALDNLIAEVDKLNAEYKRVRKDLLLKQDDADRVKIQITNSESTVEDLRKKWHEVNNEALFYDQVTICPTCGQDIPPAKLEEAKENAFKVFNLDKSKRLENINDDGKKVANNLTDKKIQYSKLADECEALIRELKEVEIKASEAGEKAETVRVGLAKVEDNPDYQNRLSDKQQLKEAISSLKADSREQLDKEKTAILNLENEIRVLQADFAKKEQREKALARITELEAEEKGLAKELEELDEQLYLADEFVKAKVRLLESKINSKFQLARFKLFDVQVNGGINECCETVFNGVPYGDLNNAARINIGLDIINTLSEHYNFYAPIFVDNRESVTHLTDVDAQVVSLMVSEQDKKLRIVPEPKAMKEAI